VFIGQSETADLLSTIMQTKDVNGGADRKLRDCWTKPQVVEHMHGIGAKGARIDVIGTKPVPDAGLRPPPACHQPVGHSNGGRADRSEAASVDQRLQSGELERRRRHLLGHLRP